MTTLAWIMDVGLVLTILFLAWRTLVSVDLFKAVVLFIAFGFFLALAWVRLNAPDVALAEAAIGSGLTGALLLSAWRRLGDAQDTESNVMSGQRKRLPGLLFALLTVLVVILAWVVLELPAEDTGLKHEVAAKMPQSGVEHPVTAVLLNFRGYDTLLEVAVLLMILIGVWSFGNVDREAPNPIDSSLVLKEATRVVVPIFIVVAGYLLWVGAHAPGGAFHGGAVLAAAGVLLTLGGRAPAAAWRRIAMVSFVLGLSMFIVVAAATYLYNGLLLYYPRSWAKFLILTIEAAATVSIGSILAALFLGGRPTAWKSPTDRAKREQ